MDVLCNPFAKHELAPTVRFEPHNGFSIRHGNIKGTWLPALPDAVRDFNGSVQRALGSLRVAEYKAEAFPLASLPGIDSAWGAYQRAKAQAEAFKTPKDGCHFPNCEEFRKAFDKALADEKTRPPQYRKDPRAILEKLMAEAEAGKSDPARIAAMKKLCGMESAKANEAGQAERRKRSKGLPFGLLGLLAMAATLGAFDDDEEDEDTPTVEIHHAEIADILAECGLFHRTGAMSGVVAIPRKLGAAFIERLEKAIRANDVEAVRLICAGVKV